MESVTLRSALRAHPSGSLHILPYSTFGADSVLIAEPEAESFTQRNKYVEAHAR